MLNLCLIKFLSNCFASILLYVIQCMYIECMSPLLAANHIKKSCQEYNDVWKTAILSFPGITHILNEIKDADSI